MPAVYLLVSLLTPWLAGLFLLRAITAHAACPVHRAREAGLALLLGYFLLHLLMLGSSAALGGISAPGINVALVAIAACAHWLQRKATGTPSPAPWQPWPGLRGRGWVFWLFLCLALSHLLLAVVEVLHRPIFAWDAWLSWMYRAKAWFFAGGVAPIDAPQQWSDGSGSAGYNVGGSHYPYLVPMTALWTAQHLGEWSETLVNLPVIALGIALAAGFYGLCREADFSPRRSMLFTYLLLSIPLVGTHLSLAGQADIWMAGYAGLGVSTCLLGLVKQRRWLVGQGLVLTALSMAVKSEGSVWLLITLATCAAVWLGAQRYRAAVLALPVAALLPWLAGVHSVELPLLGRVGLGEGTLYAGFLGAHAIEWHSVLGDYWQNFLAGGSWHLLWPLLMLSALLASRADERRTRLILLSFLGAFIASQAIIFGMTSQGRWAEDWTAINRVPLQLAPALVFCLALALPARRPEEGRRISGMPALALAASAALVLASGIALACLSLGYGSERGSVTSIPAASQRLVMGNGALSGKQRHITAFETNVAIVSSGPVSINADEVSLVSIQTSGDNRTGQNFFWRSASDPENLKIEQYEGRGLSFLRLRDHEDWGGRITEIGVVFFDDGGSLAVGDITVRPESQRARLEQIHSEWAQRAPWSHKSLNWLPAGAAQALLPLPLFVAGWLMLTLALLLIVARRDGSASLSLRPAIAACLVAWLLLDARWLTTRVSNALATAADYPIASSQPLQFGGDAAIRRLVGEAADHLPEDAKPLIITADDTSMQYQTLRAKYHALPRAGYVHGEGRDTLPAIGRQGHLLVLKQPYREPSAPPTRAEEWQAFLAERGLDYSILWESERAFLLGHPNRHARDPGKRSAP